MSPSRRRLWTQQIRRISTAALKLELGPARWRRTRCVHLEADGCAADVEVVDEPCATTKGGFRRFLRCPRCGSPRATVLGLVPGMGWSCRACAGWVGRSRTRVTTSGPGDTEPGASA